MYENELCFPRFVEKKGNEGDFHKQYNCQVLRRKICWNKACDETALHPHLNGMKVFPVRPSTISTHLSESQQQAQTSEIFFIYDRSREETFLFFFERWTFVRATKGSHNNLIKL